MSMSEIVSFLDLSIYPSVALVFFLAAFVAVVWWVMTRPEKEIEDAANIVLDDDKVVSPRIRIKQDTSDQHNGQGVSHV